MVKSRIRLTVLVAAGLCSAVVRVASADLLRVARRANGTIVISDPDGGRGFRPFSRDDATWLIANRNRATQFDDIIHSVSKEHGVDPMLVKSVVLVESGYNAGAVSNKGARGLMQLMPDTARRFGVGNSFDPFENIRGGVKYLNFLLNLFRGDLNLALAGYNAGENAVTRHGGIPPYAETQDYVRKVLTAFNGTPYVVGGRFRTEKYSRVELVSASSAPAAPAGVSTLARLPVSRTPGRPVFAWVDDGSGRPVLSANRPPSGSRRILRLSRGR